MNVAECVSLAQYTLGLLKPLLEKSAELSQNTDSEELKNAFGQFLKVAEDLQEFVQGVTNANWIKKMLTWQASAGAGSLGAETGPSCVPARRRLLCIHTPGPRLDAASNCVRRPPPRSWRTSVNAWTALRRS